MRGGVIAAIRLVTCCGVIIQVAGSPGLVPGWRSLTQLPERGEYYDPLPAILPFAGLDQEENHRERERARRFL